MNPVNRLAQYREWLQDIEPITAKGAVEQVTGLIIEGHGPVASIGDMCDIYPRLATTPIKAEVVGFKGEHLLLMPLSDMRGVHPGSLIVNRAEKATVHVSLALQGRVLDGQGRPMDAQGAIPVGVPYPLYAEPFNPLRKKRIAEPLDLGVRALNGLLTCGKGQRMGIFAGSGVGKSVLLGMIARATRADVNVIALIGERGREVREFIERDLGPVGLQRSVVVVATSDQSPLVRMRGAYVATALAEYFRDQGKDVLLMMDSLTRFAMAQREVGLSVGEPPMTKGYTPSVFALLPKLLERAGNAEKPDDEPDEQRRREAADRAHHRRGCEEDSDADDLRDDHRRGRPCRQAARRRRRHQNVTRTASCIARGPPDPNTPPAVVTGRPKLLERRYPAEPGSSESRTSTFEKPE